MIVIKCNSTKGRFWHFDFCHVSLSKSNCKNERSDTDKKISCRSIHFLLQLSPPNTFFYYLGGKKRNDQIFYFPVFIWPRSGSYLRFILFTLKSLTRTNCSYIRKYPKLGGEAFTLVYTVSYRGDYNECDTSCGNRAAETGWIHFPGTKVIYFLCFDRSC